MTSPEARAAEVIDHVGDEPSNVIAAALATEGLLMPGPQIIRTVEELGALDPDTPLVLGTGLFTVAAGARAFVNAQALLPAATVGDGAAVRAARQALREAADG